MKNELKSRNRFDTTSLLDSGGWIEAIIYPNRTMLPFIIQFEGGAFQYVVLIHYSVMHLGLIGNKQFNIHGLDCIISLF